MNEARNQKAATMSVQEYLEKHMLSRKIEEAVNAAVRAKSPDPILFIANHMRKSVRSVITKICARQIFDSRGIPAVEVDLHTTKSYFRASVSTGPLSSPILEGPVESRDGEKGKYMGAAVAKAVAAINERISQALIGMDPQLQGDIDNAMIDLDKTDNKAEIAGNAMLAVSMAVCKAGAAENEVPLYKHIAQIFDRSTTHSDRTTGHSDRSTTVLPVPSITLIDGGSHAGYTMPSWEIMILPVGASSIEEALLMGSETYHHLKVITSEKYGLNTCNVGEGGGLTPNISSIPEGLDLVIEAIDRAGYNGRIKLAINVAATDFCIGNKYDLDAKSHNKSGQNFKTGNDLIEMYTKLCTDYPLVSIEQPFDNDDWEHTKRFTDLGLCQVVGENPMANPKGIEQKINEKAYDALLLKLNQFRTVTEAIEVVKQAKDGGLGVVVSYRSGETDESFVADLAVGLGAGQIKAGAPCVERLAEYNQLLRIEEELGSNALFTGENLRPS